MTARVQIGTGAGPRTERDARTISRRGLLMGAAAYESAELNHPGESGDSPGTPGRFTYVVILERAVSPPHDVAAADSAATSPAASRPGSIPPPQASPTPSPRPPPRRPRQGRPGGPGPAIKHMQHIWKSIGFQPFKNNSRL